MADLTITAANVVAGSGARIEYGTAGVTMTGGTAYYLSPNAGGICPLADVVSGAQVVLLGVATSTTVLRLDILNSGVVI